ncbi:MAG: hypothetical protein LKE33_07365 [Acidaminococcus sp.]|jgi:hypothetical protein|nr:hypothetical protein [Acidaminococcus sp.]MCI2099828.1 hypothetical protein [Acidaminococcus sp.]MCI2114056.1 hypothetical protein [Acidaminococcus sp.]MCI2115926.1 hypothetical protein [Acidaminococcus sp.]
MGILDILEEKHDRHNRAKEYRKSAEHYIEHGKEIINRAYERASRDAYKTEKAVDDFNDFRTQVARELNTSIRPVLRNFEDFHIDSKIDVPDVGVDDIRLSSFHFSAASSIPNLDILPIFAILSFFDDSDYDAAWTAKMKAEGFYDDMKYYRIMLNNKRKKMSEIRSFLAEEQSVITSLMEKLSAAKDKLNEGMRSSSFSQEQADTLKGIAKCSKLVAKTLETQFLTDSDDIDDRAKKLLKEIQTINEELPSAPDIRRSPKVIWFGSIMY